MKYLLVDGFNLPIALIAIGVCKGDRGDLASPPQNRIDAITRRVTGAGVRRDNSGE